MPRAHKKAHPFGRALRGTLPLQLLGNRALAPLRVLLRLAEELVRKILHRLLVGRQSLLVEGGDPGDGLRVVDPEPLLKELAVLRPLPSGRKSREGLELD